MDEAEMIADLESRAALIEPVRGSGCGAISDARIDLLIPIIRGKPLSLAHLDGGWPRRFEEKIFGDYREGLATARYHVMRVAELERLTYEIAVAHELGGIGFHSRSLTAEYQAFELSRRWTLEYLAQAVSAYFKCNGGMRKLSDRVAGEEPLAASDAIRDRLEATDLDPLIGNRSGMKSVRDRNVHEESISPGTVNIGRRADGKPWVRLVGDEENLATIRAPHEAKVLSKVLEKRVEDVEALGCGFAEDLGLTRPR